MAQQKGIEHQLGLIWTRLNQIDFRLSKLLENEERIAELFVKVIKLERRITKQEYEAVKND